MTWTVRNGELCLMTSANARTSRTMTRVHMTLTEAVLAAFFLGLAGSTHCLGMCGAIIVNLSFSLPEQERTARRLLYWHLLVNAGRITLYTLLGAFAGGV